MQAGTGGGGGEKEGVGCGRSLVEAAWMRDVSVTAADPRGVDARVLISHGSRVQLCLRSLTLFITVRNQHTEVRKQDSKSTLNFAHFNCH